MRRHFLFSVAHGRGVHVQFARIALVDACSPPMRFGTWSRRRCPCSRFRRLCWWVGGVDGVGVVCVGVAVGAVAGWVRGRGRVVMQMMKRIHSSSYAC